MRIKKNRLRKQKSSKQFEVKVIKSQGLLLYNLQYENSFFKIKAFKTELK